ncbi:MAG: hypothetical protein QF563_02765 [Candidatus Marinimicrobia bacterium]|nr:hypothetical protein [Candidatus Neomarinimicrobiota bacterium]
MAFSTWNQVASGGRDRVGAGDCEVHGIDSLYRGLCLNCSGEQDTNHR